MKKTSLILLCLFSALIAAAAGNAIEYNCTSENLGLCADETSCMDAGGVWDGYECEKAEEAEDECTTDADCEDDEACNNGECEDADEDADTNEEEDEKDEESEEDEEDEETELETDEEEVKVFDILLGAKIRMLQLEKRIMRNIYFGQEAVNYIDDENITSEANAILDEMSLLLDEIAEYEYDGKDKEALVRDFLAYKARAIDLTRKFRKLVRGEITGQEARDIRNALKDLDKAELEDISDEIREQIWELNALRLEQTLAAMEAENDALVEKVRNGEATRNEVKGFIRESWKSLDGPQKKEVVRKAVQQRLRKAAYYKDVNDRIITQSEKQFLRTKAKAASRIKNLKRKIIAGEVELSAVKERIRNNIKERKETIKQNMQERRDAIKDNIQTRRQNIQNRRETVKQDAANRRASSAAGNADAAPAEDSTTDTTADAASS
ncbi:hypothetical protein GF323_04765 [Candidatus Woesearchaeota archaeon]|nr:hypothetical protein [Candidatus Woesearchaeota archaeon]